MMSKLEYQLDARGDKPKTANWDQRPRDVAYLARWVGKVVERNLNWQVVNLSADAAGLHDAPILYIAGNQTLSFTEAEEAKLRQYVEQGGMIVGNANCGSAAFSKSFKDLGQKLFNKYEFRVLPADHIIFKGELGAASSKVPVKLESLSNGCREMMVLIPSADAARYWQTMTYRGHEEVWKALANLYIYSIDKDVRYRGDSYVVLPNPRALLRGSIKVARLRAGDNWDPEPGGWRQLAAVMHNQDAIDLSTTEVKLGEGQLSTFTIAHWTGTTKAHLSDVQRSELQAFVEHGGTLIVDAAGGSAEFGVTSHGELASIFPEALTALERPLPPDHPLYAATGEKPASFGYRRFARAAMAGQLSAPRLSGLTVNGRLAVLYSAEDLSVGLVGHPVDGVLGYDPQSATRIMRSILRFATAK